MGVITAYKARKYINSLSSYHDLKHPDALKAANRIKEIGSASIPHLIESLDRNKAHGVVYEILMGFISNETLPLFVKTLSNCNAKISAEIVNLLSASTSYDPNYILEVFTDRSDTQAALIKILDRHKDRLSAQSIKNLLAKMDKENRTSILRLLEKITTDHTVSELLPWTQNDDWVTRLGMARILGRFRSHQVETTLVELLEDPHRSVRQTALEGLANLNNPETIGSICSLIRDSELTIQSKAIEIIIQKKMPTTVPYLLDLLQDESEYVRRGAIEVLNAIADTSAIKNLLQALRDKDWWVRVRAADALGTIGGTVVVDAVLELIRDKDPFIRRTAVEILNTTSDERTFDALVDATKDEDWWVRERAIDALAKLGTDRAVSVLQSLIGKDDDTSRVVIRALATLGHSQALKSVLRMVRNSDSEVAKEALQALVVLTNESSAAEVQGEIFKLRQGACQSINDLADSTLQILIKKFGDHVGYEKLITHNANSNSGQPCDYNQSLVVEARTSAKGSSLDSYTSGGSTAPLVIDIKTLEAGQMLQDRYRYIRGVGKGAFGTALLVEDTAVKEQIVLKFLHAQLAATEQLVKRFVRELRYARKITHENVIRIYDFLTFGQSYAISMEYFDSNALSAYLQSNVKISHRTAFKLIQSICSGMFVAHQAHVHR